MDISVVIQAIFVAALTAAATTYVNVKIMKPQIARLEIDVQRLSLAVQALEVIVAEMRGRATK